MRTCLNLTGTSGLLLATGLLDDKGSANHGALGVANYGIDVRVLLECLEDVVQGIAPDLLVPVLTLASVLEHAHGVLSIDTVRHVPQAAKVGEVVAVPRVKKAEQWAGTEVVLPSFRRLNLVGTLGVGECGETSFFQLASQGTELDLEVLLCNSGISHVIFIITNSYT